MPYRLEPFSRSSRPRESAEPAAPAALGGPPVPESSSAAPAPDPTDAGAVPPGEVGEGVGAASGQRDLKKEACSLKHLMTPLPKNPYCDACTRAKMKRKPRRQKENKAETSEAPTTFGEIVTFDHLIALLFCFGSVGLLRGIFRV